MQACNYLQKIYLLLIHIDPYQFLVLWICYRHEQILWGGMCVNTWKDNIANNEVDKAILILVF